MGERERVERHSPERTLATLSPEIEGVNTADLVEAVASTELSVVLTESYRFLRRRRKEDLPKVSSKSEVELLRRVLDMTGSPERLAKWIFAPLRVLGDRIPYEVMQSEEGLRELEAILDALEYGPAYG